MPPWGRKDADLVRDVPAYRRIMPFIMRTRTESAVHFEQSLDAGPGLAFLEAWNAAHEQRISFLHLVLWALAQTLHERPRLNRFTMGRRLWQRRGVFISFSAKKALDDASPIVVVKQRFEPALNFEQLVAQTHGSVREGRSDRESRVDKELKLFLAAPAPVLAFFVRLAAWLDSWNLLPFAFFRDDPLYASVFVANLGSVKLDAAHHHLYEYGNIPIFATVGRLHDAVVARADGTVTTRRELTIKWTLDERIEDGLYCARALELMRTRLEDPAVLARLLGPAPLQSAS